MGPTDRDTEATLITSARLKFAEQTLVPFEAAYRDLSATWAALETKAQGATAIAGIFLGITISVLNGNANTLTRPQKLFSVGIAAALAVAVVLALMALTPRSVPLLNPEERFRKARDILALEHDAEFLS